jgi:excisionase family DNA binding protein
MRSAISILPERSSTPATERVGNEFRRENVERQRRRMHIFDDEPTAPHGEYQASDLCLRSRRGNDALLQHTSLHRLISSRIAAARLGVSQSTLLRAVARGWLLPALTTPGGHRRFRAHDVERLAAGPPGQSSSPDLVTSSEAARLLGVSQHTVNRAAREGRLRSAAVTPGGHRRFASSDLAWVVLDASSPHDGEDDGRG